MDTFLIVIIVVIQNIFLAYIAYKIGWNHGYDMADKWADHYFKMWQHGEDDTKEMEELRKSNRLMSEVLKDAGIKEIRTRRIV